MLREQGRRTIQSNQIIFGIGSNNNNWGRIRLTGHMRLSNDRASALLPISATCRDDKD